VDGIEADEARCRLHVEGATASLTAMVETLGYEKAEALAARTRSEGKSIREVVEESGCLSPEEFDRLVSPENVARLGSSDSEEKK
jgi:aspartate ammonia-lyase